MTKTIAIATLLLGVTLGAVYAYMGVRDPGPDFTLLEIQPYTPYEKPPEGVSQSNDSGDNANDGTPTLDPEAGAQDAPPKKQLPLEVVNGEEFDFGVMEEGESRSHSFILRNNTREDVALKVLETTCKCTVGDFQDEPGSFEDGAVLPGKQCKVELTWKPLMLQPDFRQSATIATSLNERSEIILSVFGKVRQTISAFPRDIAFSDVSFRSSRESELVIHSLQDPNFKILEHSWMNKEIAEYFTYEPIEVTDEHRVQDEDALVTLPGLVRMKSGLPLGPFRQVLQLKTNMEKSGLLEIPVRGRVVGDISLAGTKFIEPRNLLRLGAIPKNRGAEAKMRMTVKGPFAKNFKITGFRTEPEGLKASAVTTTALNNGLVTLVVLKVEVDKDAKPGNFTGGELYDIGKVVMKTNHPQLPEVSFDVEFAVTE